VEHPEEEETLHGEEDHEHPQPMGLLLVATFPHYPLDYGYSAFSSGEQGRVVIPLPFSQHPKNRTLVMPQPWFLSA